MARLAVQRAEGAWPPVLGGVERSGFSRWAIPGHWRCACDARASFWNACSWSVLREFVQIFLCIPMVNCSFGKGHNHISPLWLLYQMAPDSVISWAIRDELLELSVRTVCISLGWVSMCWLGFLAGSSRSWLIIWLAISLPFQKNFFLGHIWRYSCSNNQKLLLVNLAKTSGTRVWIWVSACKIDTPISCTIAPSFLPFSKSCVAGQLFFMLHQLDVVSSVFLSTCKGL